MHGITPTGENAAYLELTKLGEYKFNLTVGGASREFSIVVNSFPTLKLVSAFRGAATDGDTVAVATKELIYRGYPQIPVGTAYLHLDLEGVNTSAVKYAVLENDSPAATNISAYTAAELTAIEAKFTAGVLRLVQTVDAPTTAGFKPFTAFLYNADKVNIGRAVLGYYVIEQLPIVSMPDNAGSVTAFFTSIGSASNTNVNATIAVDGGDSIQRGMLAKTIEIAPASSDAALNSTQLSKIVSEIIRNITVFGANKDITLDKVFMAAGADYTSGTFPTTGQVTDLSVNYVKSNGYYISLLVKDFDGNSRTIYVRLVRRA
jgi:hypothetical protein